MSATTDRTESLQSLGTSLNVVITIPQSKESEPEPQIKHKQPIFLV